MSNKKRISVHHVNHSYKIVSYSSNHIAVMFDINEDWQRLLKKSLLVTSAVMETGKALGLVQQVPCIPSTEPWINSKQRSYIAYIVSRPFPQEVQHLNWCTLLVYVA